MTIGNQGLQNQLDLRTLVGIGSELGMVEKGIKHSEIGVAKL